MTVAGQGAKATGAVASAFSVVLLPLSLRFESLFGHGLDCGLCLACQFFAPVAVGGDGSADANLHFYASKP